MRAEGRMLDIGDPTIGASEAAVGEHLLVGSSAADAQASHVARKELGLPVIGALFAEHVGQHVCEQPAIRCVRRVVRIGGAGDVGSSQIEQTLLLRVVIVRRRAPARRG